MNMMTDTLCVIALDAADYELVRRWKCKNILLDEHGAMDVFSHSLDVPYTPEIWTTVATGKHPENHAVEGDVREWNNAALEALSTMTQWLPSDFRELLGGPFRRAGAKRSFKRTDANHVFDRVFGWPGITSADHLWEAWEWFSQAENNQLTTRELDRKLRGNTGQELGWLAAMSKSECSLIGVHAHVLDVVGHVSATDPERLRYVYEWVNELIGWLRSIVDQLVILSDHGMQTTVTNDEDPGRHSMRAFVAAQGVSQSVPESVFDVRDWLDAERGTQSDDDGSEVDISAVSEHLSDLGYLAE